MQPAARATETESPDDPVPELVWAGMPYPLLLDVSSLKLTDQQLEKIFSDNVNLQFELTPKGELVIMAPTGYPGLEQEMELARQVANWAKLDGTGIASGPSGGFRLPNRALYVPDASWTDRTRIEDWVIRRDAPPRSERRAFPALCPDFVVELRPEGDPLPMLQRKMEEYLENGARLGWLIDPINRRVHVYRPGEPVQVLESPETVSGNPVLSGFELDLVEIW